MYNFQTYKHAHTQYGDMHACMHVYIDIAKNTCTYLRIH